MHAIQYYKEDSNKNNIRQEHFLMLIWEKYIDYLTSVR